MWGCCYCFDASGGGADAGASSVTNVCGDATCGGGGGVGIGAAVAVAGGDSGGGVGGVDNGGAVAGGGSGVDGVGIGSGVAGGAGNASLFLPHMKRGLGKVWKKKRGKRNSFINVPQENSNEIFLERYF